MMPSKILCAAAFLACALKFGATQTSCKGRCGAEYYRGYICQCDYTCLSYGECCEDYESKCTTTNSCRGRCGESFKRGRLCTCDPDCIKYKQCCPDYKTHCDAEEMSGAASATAPVKTSSCDSINDSKPKDPLLTEATEEPPLGDDNNADDYIIPLDVPTSYPPDDLTDDTHNQIIPSYEEDPEASTIPESSSGNGPSTIDPLDQTPIEPTLGPDPLELTTPTEPVHSDDVNLSTLSPTTEKPTADAGDLTNASDQGTAFPQLAVSTDRDSSLLTSTSVPEIAAGSSTDASEIMTSSRPSEEPEVTTINMQDSDTVAASALASTATPEETTSNSDTENNPEDVATDAPSITSPSTTLSELDAALIQDSSSTAPVQEDTTHNVRPEITTTSPVKGTLKVTSPPVSEPTSKPGDKPDPSKLPPTSKPADKPDPSKLPPTSKPETKPLDPQTLTIDDPRNYQGDDNNDTNLCSGRPVGGLTTLSNGTIVVFRGHYFWFLDRNRVPGPARGITEVWGVPSPIDTVFTRCNCQGKTYILRGGRYWRFENDVLDPGYPRVIRTGFGGLQGHITAALSVPQYQNRGESVYFFKRGGFVQKYAYQFGTTPKCGRKVNYSTKTILIRKARQAVSVLEPAINIRTSWRGFPSTITAAVSVPSTREPDGYKYFVFSRSKSYNVRLDGQRPVITAPKQNASPQTNNVFRCPTKS